MVYCCNVLEHVRDLDRVIAETSRVLKPGGVYLYDTINRTFLSNLLLIKVAQEWTWMRIIDVTLHDWTTFIKSEEPLAIVTRHGLNDKEIVGFGPRGNPLKMLGAYWRLKNCRTTYIALGRAMNTDPIRIMSISYMGYAIKQGSAKTPVPSASSVHEDEYHRVWSIALSSSELHPSQMERMSKVANIPASSCGPSRFPGGDTSVASKFCVLVSNTRLTCKSCDLHKETS